MQPGKDSERGGHRAEVIPSCCPDLRRSSWLSRAHALVCSGLLQGELLSGTSGAACGEELQVLAAGS